MSITVSTTVSLSIHSMPFKSCFNILATAKLVLQCMLGTCIFLNYGLLKVNVSEIAALYDSSIFRFF